MRSGIRAAGWSTIISAIVLLAGPIGLVGPASAHALAGASPVQQWAYGAQANASASWTNTSDGYVATLTAFFGWDVVITQTNSSATISQLEASRTMALDLYVTYCKPTCQAAGVTANASFRAWETETGFANLTTNGTVYSGDQPRPALALLNASGQVKANLTENLDGAVHVLFSTKLVSYYATVQAEAHAAVEFSPALGLVPNAITPGSSWNSSSDFSASGAWAAQFMYAKSPLNDPPSNGSGSLSGNVAGSGNVALSGIDFGSVTLDNGDVTDAVSLLIDGPFHVREGFLLLPSNADVFGAGDQSWSQHVNSTASAGTASVNVGSHLPHLGLLASLTAYSPRSSQVSALGPQPALALPPDGTNGAGVLQAQPEPVGVAQQNSACLLAGTCPDQQNPIEPAKRGTIGAAVIALALVVVAALLAVGVVAGRRRAVPAPPSPNARLYPPSVAARPPPLPPGARARPPPPDPPDDPLGHLW